MSTNKHVLFSRYLPVLLWAIVIFVFSANPDPYYALPQSWSETSTSASTVTPTKIPNAISIAEELGRFLHLSEYLILAILVCRMVVWQNKVTPFSIIAVIGLSSIYAISDELHQYYVPGRAFQVSDLVLDIIGILVGTLVFHLINRIAKKRVPRP